ncbi:hypothetical protein C0J52_00406 [Blattella germanica]|nr:hypothetical protein C0J52_00406 [Blattella germanica]
MPLFVYIETKLLAHWSRKSPIKFIWTVAIVLFTYNVCIIGYFGWIHQRGALDVMKELPTKATSKTELLFLMPCHSTPLYSHLHAEIPARFLTCEPDFTGNPEYKDEADLFYDNPEKWLKENFPKNATASHVILFDVLVPHIQSFLNKNNYKLKSKLFHMYRPSGRVGEYVQVFTKE